MPTPKTRHERISALRAAIRLCERVTKPTLNIYAMDSPFGLGSVGPDIVVGLPDGVPVHRRRHVVLKERTTMMVMIDSAHCVIGQETEQNEENL